MVIDNCTSDAHEAGVWRPNRRQEQQMERAEERRIPLNTQKMSSGLLQDICYDVD